ncbi:MAG: hypothetical protein DRG87_02335 [Deltaproteobacteria bacterium]|nr:hypothetical protein [Deltaproteobacteria bacterium]MBW2077398.1 hypothetical protein [Deltaproteobacteria bacterium]MBW2311356.1 hypothetical protein [Deltaproteobacteria bacterium]RLB31465.1 MAG: hypothetical protein DRG87_02335 [Deltaproteobacteria bacterium]
MRSKTMMIGPVIVLVLFVSSIAFAGTHLIELNASQSTIEGGYDHKMPVEYGFLTAGIGALYSEDDYKIANAKFTLGDGISSAGLRFNLGFKGVLGNVEEDGREADLMAVGFLFSGSFTIPETIMPLPVDLSLTLTMAPEPLCFVDSDRYMDFRVSFDFRIVKNAAIILGYRHIETRLEQDQENWETEDGTLFIGYQLKF